MIFRKPYRICNTDTTGIIAPVAEKSHVVTSTLKELKDRYELRIWIPSRQRHYEVCIIAGMLYVYEANSAAAGEDCNALGCFLLPANVRQNEIKAFYRNYGLKVVMPIPPPDGTIIKVPIV